MSADLKILLIEDNPGDARLLYEILNENMESPFKVNYAESLLEGLIVLLEEENDAILLDIGLPDSQGINSFLQVQSKAGDIPIIILTGLEDEELAVEAVQKGAQDYLNKAELNGNILLRTIRYAIERNRFKMKLKEYSTELKIKEANFRSIVENSADGIIIVDFDGRIRLVNPAAANLFPFRAEEKLYHIFGFPLEQGECCEINLAGQGKKVFLEMQILETYWEEEPAHLVTLRNITERKQAEEALRESQQTLSDIVNFLPDATVVINEKGRVISWNQAMEKMTGVKAEDMLGKGNYEYSLPFYGERKPVMIDFILKSNKIPGEYKPVEERPGVYCGEGYYPAIGEQGMNAQINSSILYNMSGERIGAIASIRDITERKKAEDSIRYLSFFDKLTGIYNRAFFEEELKRLDTPRQLPLTLIIADLNGLKLINDAFGHRAGDKLLQKVASILQSVCRKEDIVARWGGDEFVVLLPKIDSKAGTLIYKRIKNACLKSKHPLFPVSVSLGLASKTDSSQKIDEVLKEAEDKMYRNKLLENKSIRSSFITSLEQTLWTRSHETEEHCYRMRKMVENFGRSLGLVDSELDNLILLAALHDIGKIAIPNSILDSPNSLSSQEWEVIRKHPETGYRIALSSAELAGIADAILTHHERWDGNGYPLGQKGDEILLMSRILAIVDAYDVMLHGRPYKQPFSHEDVLQELRRCAGSQFDPYLVSDFLKLV